MKNASLKIFSVFTLLALLVVLHQNCGGKNYSAQLISSIEGKVGQPDSSGKIPIEVRVIGCERPEDLTKDFCKEIREVEVKVKDGPDLDTVVLDPEVKEIDGVPVVRYVGFITVNIVQLECKTLIFILFDDLTGTPVIIAQIEIPGPGCKQDDGPFSIDTITQQGRLFEAVGKCSGSAGITFAGDISPNIDKTAVCNGGTTFSFCSFSTRHGLSNTLNGAQGSNSDSASFVGAGLPKTFVTIDDSYQNPATKPLMLKGRCTPFGVITVSIYGNEQATKPVCSAAGTWQYGPEPILLTNLTDRRVDVSIQGQTRMDIHTNIDSTSVPACTISAKVKGSICSKQSGSISGACRTGLPVELIVEGQPQQVVVCSGGVYTFQNVLLKKVGVNNTIIVKQVQTAPLGEVKPCSQSVVLQQFPQ